MRHYLIVLVFGLTTANANLIPDQYADRTHISLENLCDPQTLNGLNIQNVLQRHQELHGQGIMDDVTDKILDVSEERKKLKELVNLNVLIKNKRKTETPDQQKVSENILKESIKQIQQTQNKISDDLLGIKIILPLQPEQLAYIRDIEMKS